MSRINISGISKPKLLAALYNNACPLGMGYLQYTPEPMTEEQAEELLKTQTYFDYHKGRVMKVNFSTDDLYTGGYNMDNGEGSCERIVESVR